MKSTLTTLLASRVSLAVDFTAITARASSRHAAAARWLAQATEQAVTRISEPDEQARVLIQLAETLAKQGTDAARSRSRRLIAKTLASSSWLSAMPLLGSLYPEVVNSMGTAMLDSFAPASTTK